MLGDDAVLGHLQGAVVGVLVHREVGGLGADLVELDGGGGGAGVGLSGVELGLLGVDLGDDFDLIELSEHLALLNHGIDVSVETGNDAGGLGFNFDLGDRLDFTGRDDGLRNIAAFCLAELGGFQLGAVSTGGNGHAQDSGYNEDDEAAPDPELAFAFAVRCHGATPEKWEYFGLGEVVRRPVSDSSMRRV